MGSGQDSRGGTEENLRKGATFFGPNLSWDFLEAFGDRVKMRAAFAIFLLFNSGLALNIVDQQRACPDGYFYGGEIQQSSQRDIVVEKGETSPTYSCYSVHTWNQDLVNGWINATQRCGDEEGASGELLSVNNVGESQILTSDLFLTAAFGKDKNGNVILPQTTFTSGISLAPGEWTWFGAGKEENSTVDELIEASLNNNNGTTNGTSMTSGFTPCLSVTFVNKTRPVGGNSSSEEWFVALEYSAVPCVNNITTTICEVSVRADLVCVVHDQLAPDSLPPHPCPSSRLLLCHLPDLGVSPQPSTPWHNPKAFRRPTCLLCKGRAIPDYKGKAGSRCREVH